MEMASAPKVLDRRLTVLAPTKGKDSDGGPTTVFSPLGGLRHCHRQDVAGSEVRVAGANRSRARAVFTIRWFTELSTEHRLDHEGRIYDITAPPRELGRRQFWEIDAEHNPAKS